MSFEVPYLFAQLFDLALEVGFAAPQTGVAGLEGRCEAVRDPGESTPQVAGGDAEAPEQRVAGGAGRRGRDEGSGGEATQGAEKDAG